jgi:hypothetical protein
MEVEEKLRKVEATASDLDKDVVKIARGSLNLLNPLNLLNFFP